MTLKYVMVGFIIAYDDIGEPLTPFIGQGYKLQSNYNLSLIFISFIKAKHLQEVKDFLNVNYILECK